MPRKRPQPTRKKLTAEGQKLKAARQNLSLATARIETMRKEKVIRNESEAAAIKLYILYMSVKLNGTRRKWTRKEMEQIKLGKKLYDSKQEDYFPEMQGVSNMFGKINYQDDTLWYKNPIFNNMSCTNKFKAPCPRSPVQCMHMTGQRREICMDAFCKGQNPNNESKRSACNKAMSYTSEPIPDYIMRALKPKKSVHPEYGKLRY